MTARHDNSNLRPSGRTLRVLHGRENDRRIAAHSVRPTGAATLAQFCERDLMIRLDGQYLSLALPGKPIQYV